MEQRPEKLNSKRYLKMTGCGHLYIHIVRKEGKIYEVFLVMGKSGVCANAQNESIGRLVSLLLEKGVVSVEEVIKELKGIECSSPVEGIKSCADAVAQVLREEMEGGGNEIS